MRRLRYADLLTLGIVNNRATLQNWINNQNFPKGSLTGPNSRTWSEAEVQRWLDSRPTGPKSTPSTKGRPRKAGRQSAETAST